MSDPGEAPHVDFYISYAGVDHEWAEWIAHRLVDAGYSIELDTWQWAAGTNFIVAMNDALERADRVLALYTDAYFAGRYAQAEHAAAFAASPGRVVPILIEDCVVPKLYRTLKTIDLRGTDESEATRRLVRDIPGPVGFPADLAISSHFPRRLPQVFNAPARNPFFTGRVSTLSEIHSRIGRAERQNSGTVAISPLRGMGGVGKTQLAIEYAHRQGADFGIVWWINAEDTILTSSGLIELADALSLPIDQPTPSIIRELWKTLRSRDGWLLIYDNVVDVATLTDLRPPDNGCILLTSRDPRVSRLADVVEVSVFARPESITLLRRRCPRLAEGEADRIAAAVGDLPLAVEQAGCFLTDTGIDSADYLELLVTEPTLAGLADPTIDRHPGLVAVVEAGAARLATANGVAADFLNQVAFCAPEPLPLVPRSGAAPPSKFGVSVGNVAVTAKIVRDVTRLGLVRLSGTAIQAHRLVQVLLRARLSPEERADAHSAALALVSTANPGDPNDTSNWLGYATIVPHVQSLIESTEYARRLSAEPAEFRTLVLDVARYLDVSGQYEVGRSLIEKAHRNWSETLGPDHETTLQAAVRLGVFLWHSGQLVQARGLDTDSLARLRRVLGEDHPDTLSAANNLGATLEALGEYEAARAVFTDTLARRRRVLGESHSETLLTANNLAVTLGHGLGQHEAARDLHQDTFTRYVEKLGANHPSTLRSSTSLAAELASLGEYSSAISLLRDTLSLSRRELGPDHADTLRTAHNLGVAYVGAHDYAKARDVFEDVRARRDRLLGSDHFFTLSVGMALASCLNDLGERGRAVDLLNDVTGRYRRTFGEDHRLTRDAERMLESFARR